VGRRARKGGVTNAVARAARAALAEQDDEAAAIANHVYAIALEFRRQGATRMPLSVEAPLLAAAERAAQGVVLRDGLEMTEENVNDIANYLITVFREAVITIGADTLGQARAALAPRSTKGETDERNDGRAAAHGSPREGERDTASEGRDQAGDPDGRDLDRGSDRSSGVSDDGRLGGHPPAPAVGEDAGGEVLQRDRGESSSEVRGPDGPAEAADPRGT
jgi:hypothetical protein